MIVVWYALSFLFSSVGFALVVFGPAGNRGGVAGSEAGRLVVDASRGYGCGLGCCRGADGDLGIHFLSVVAEVLVDMAMFENARLMDVSIDNTD